MKDEPGIFAGTANPELATAAKSMPGFFRNRTEAGRMLAEKLRAYANHPDVLVLALPRGGVSLAWVAYGKGNQKQK